jgi:acetyl-CoA carboxylase beta subunit
MIDRVVHRREMRKVLGDILAVLMKKTADHVVEAEPV